MCVPPPAKGRQDLHMLPPVSECLGNLVTQVKKNKRMGYKKPLTPRFRSQINVQMNQLALEFAAVASEKNLLSDAQKSGHRAGGTGSRTHLQPRWSRQNVNVCVVEVPVVLLTSDSRVYGGFPQRRHRTPRGSLTVMQLSRPPATG